MTWSASKLGSLRRLFLVAGLLALALFSRGPRDPAYAAALYQPGSFGFDISFPQCPSNFPGRAAFGIVGVNYGRPWTINPCLSSEFQWASQQTSLAGFYMNTSNPGPMNPNWQEPGPRPCLDYNSYDDQGCAYNFGWNGAAQAFAAAASATSSTAASNSPWWLDVETSNSWNGSTSVNSAAIQGYFDYLRASSVPTVGIYSTSLQWNSITGGYTLAGAPNWVAGASDGSDPTSFCAKSFGGGSVWLVQFTLLGFHGDYACSGSPSPGTPATIAQTVAYSPPSAAARGFPSTACGGGQASVTFAWTPGTGGRVQWLDVSLSDNNFDPGTFASAGPLAPNMSQFSWNGFSVGVPYFWRVNTLTANGWLPTDTGSFVPCGGPQLGSTTYVCTPDGRATVTLSFAPPSPSGSSNWLDLSLFDNGFAPGSFVSTGPLSGATGQVVWPGILPNLTTYWRYNSYVAGQWIATPTGTFYASC